jgi:hypothetical protein
MNNLKISHYIKVLFREGTEWEHKGLLPSTSSVKFSVRIYSWRKRLILLVPSLIILYFLKDGFSNDFMNYVMTALAIFVGLFTNLIIVLYQRYSTLPKGDEPNQNSHRNILNNEKIKNFIRQFTFVTGKNLLIATCVIILLSIFMLFKGLATLNLGHLELVRTLKDIDFASALLFLKALAAIIVRFLIVYALIDFSILLLYSLGSLFAFLKGEYKQE